MKETKNVPQLRFSGFDDEWENKEFSELFERRMERNNGQFGYDRWISVAKMYFQKPDKVTSNNIDTRTYVMRKSDIAFEGHSNKDYKLGRFVENDIGDGVISELFPIYKHIASYDLNYWKYAIQIERIMFPKLTKCIEISYTSSNKLDEYFFLKEHVLVPSCSEQKKIGTFISHVDSLIQAKTKKLESLKAVKKSLLQKCFPRTMSNVQCEMSNDNCKSHTANCKLSLVPEMRFAGFSGDWEEKKLGEVCEINPSSNLPSVFEYVDLESVLGSEMISHRTEFKGNAPSRAQRLAKKGDVFYQTVRPYQKNNYLFELDSTNYVFSTGYAQLRPNGINSKFLMCQIQSDTFVNKVLEKCTGTSYPAINSTELSEITLLVSNDFVEQQKIGQFFSKYDSLISAQQKEIDKLKDIKKALLQKMFI